MVPTTTLFAVSASWDYEGQSAPVGVFTTRELAQAFIDRQEALNAAHYHWRKAQPRIPTPAELGGLYAEQEQAAWDDWEANEPKLGLSGGDGWEIDEVEVNP